MIRHFECPEGATPIDDCSGLIPIWVHHLNDLNRIEAENILKAQQKYLRGAVKDPKQWFQVKKLTAIHKAMFGEVWEWAGLYRKSITSVGIKPSLVPSQLAELCFEVISWLENPVELTFIEMAARIHHRLVFIHPFENGNGRFSRLIADRFLLAFRCIHPKWPNDLNQEGVTRKDYIKTLKNADSGDYGPLVDFMRKFGATDPKIEDILGNRFYLPYLGKNQGPSLIRALLKSEQNRNTASWDSHRSVELAAKLGMDEIVKILEDAMFQNASLKQ